MKLLLAALLVLAVAVPATAAGDPQVTDPCGDLLVYGRVADQDVSTPGDQTAPFDIKSVTLTSVAGGVDAVIEVCGDAVEPAQFQGYVLRWAIGEKCAGSLNLARGQDVNIPQGVATDLRASLQHSCTEPPGDGELFGTSHIVFRTLLPPSAVQIEGSRVTFSVRRSDLPSEARLLMSAGTVWAAPSAQGRYLPASGIGSVFFTDPEHSIRVSDGADGTLGGRDYVVGG